MLIAELNATIEASDRLAAEAREVGNEAYAAANEETAKLARALLAHLERP